MFRKVLIANRGEIACRIIRSLQKLGVQSVAVYSEADRNTPHTILADEAVCIGPAPVSKSYLQIEKHIEAALQTGAEAIHPGYGLLSENREFADACAANGIAFIGPKSDHLTAFGLKHEARSIVERSGGPLLPGTDLVKDVEEATEAASRIGYPVMVKSTAGGGGIGMKICHNGSELAEAFSQVQRLSENHFGQGGIFLEKFIENARHLEVQIFGNGAGGIVSLGVRDCSAQRRNQKVIEETPPANVPDSVISGLQESALRLARSVHYLSAGTVEFIYDNDSEEFYFLEVNTRLQVEHGVTELVTGVDLVEWMVLQAAGTDVLADKPDIIPQRGHAIEARVYAEDPFKDFQPSSGILTQVTWPDNIRLDSWVASGTEVSPYYDPLLAKVLVCESTRDDALDSMLSALQQSRIAGIESNLGYLRSVADSTTFREATMLTRSLASHAYKPESMEILRGGTLTTVQDYPGRTGYWAVGVPPSGPMDDLSFQLANRLLGNDPSVAGIEITAMGPRIQFNTPAAFILTGAEAGATLNGQSIAMFQVIEAGQGDILDIGKVSGPGVRTYLGIRGGIDVPEYLGSRSTFTLGQFGGHGGRALRTGDILHLGKPIGEEHPGPTPTLPEGNRPSIREDWEIGVLYGPHGAPDFFTDADIAMFFSTAWEVHYNSARTGVRLIGPKPEWARSDGGEAGLHPSNIHDNAYAIGAVDFTGDMPVILGPDGPSLGGFVCPVTVASAELWKLGQLRPGNTVRFKCLTTGEADRIRQDKAAFLDDPFGTELPDTVNDHLPSHAEAVLHASETGPDPLVVRRAGDAFVLAEIGEMQLDFRLRFHIHVLYESLQKECLEGVIDLTPGIRSLQVHFDPSVLSVERVTDWLVSVNRNLPPLEDISVRSRIVHLPLSWDDPSTREATQRYMQSVRPDAPWCPDNIEFIRRINGLQSAEAVKEIVFNSAYVVLGLGDVYLGAPVATPLDPRHRLVTTKYNPARTWTPENAVGIGGAYLCIYGMEGPGGYQFVGRTLQMWNRYKTTASFKPGKPWLLRFFDQIRFYPVSTSELEAIRRDFPDGRFIPEIEESEFNLGSYLEFLESNRESINAFKATQQQAFNEERQRWEEAGLTTYEEETQEDAASGEVALPDHLIPVESPVSGSVWKSCIAAEGERVAESASLAILESMKMEVTIDAPCEGVVEHIMVKEGQPVASGQVLFAINPRPEKA